MANKRDQLYSESLQSVSAFEFDNKVATVFEDMISRSVPGYTQILNLLPTLARQCRFPGANYYDLGCSLGAAMISLAQGLQDINAKLIGVDNSAAMLAKAEPLLAQQLQGKSLEYQLQQADINDIKLHNAAMIVMNFTLQFIAMESRDNLIQRLYNSMLDGGILVLSEKIAFNDSKTAEAFTKIHHQYKADQGYSDLEISQKRDAIENVLIPETLVTHLERLGKAGFKVVNPWIQNLQFISILAIK